MSNLKNIIEPTMKLGKIMLDVNNWYVLTVKDANNLFSVHIGQRSDGVLITNYYTSVETTWFDGWNNGNGINVVLHYKPSN